MPGPSADAAMVWRAIRHSELCGQAPIEPAARLSTSDRKGRYNVNFGSGTFVFADAAAGKRQAITVHYHRPRTHGPTDKILMLMSGFDRAAGYFRDCWASYAEDLNLLVIAPEFDHENFPGAPEYNYGNVRSAAGINNRDAWTFEIIDRLFQEIKRTTASQRSGFSLFGHSAGAQFAHRYLAFARQGLTEIVIAANAGWYMVPNSAMACPAGVAGTGFSDGDLRRFLAGPMVILLSDADADENAADLPKNPEAVAQGAHRLARGLSHFDECRAVAGSIGAPFGWRLVIAPGVGHDDAQVAAAASEVLKTA